MLTGLYWNNISMFRIIRKFVFINAVVKMFVNQIWENIGIQLDSFGGSVTRLTTFFSLSIPENVRHLLWSSLTEWKHWIKFPFFNIENIRVFFESFNDGWERRMCVFFWKIITIIRYLKNVWKEVMKSYAHFLAIKNIIFFFIKDNLFTFWCVFCEKRNNSFPGGSVTRDFFCIKAFKVHFFWFSSTVS